MAFWQANGIWAAIGQKKHLFREPRDANDVDELLAAYSKAIESSFDCEGVGYDHQECCTIKERVTATRKHPRGALLLSVVGGKMSEGINFADGLGRCVVMVGLPYANPQELCLQEKMAHLEQVREICFFGPVNLRRDSNLLIFAFRFKALAAGSSTIQIYA